VHPCERLRKSRLESQEQTVPSLIAMAPDASVAHADDVDNPRSIARPAAG